MTNKKTLTILVFLTLVSSTVTGIQITEISTEPIHPQFGENVTVHADVDAEGDYTQRVNLEVVRGNDEIVNEDMELVNGTRYESGSYEVENAFETINESAMYYLAVTAVASNEDTDSGGHVLDVRENTTIIEDSEDDRPDDIINRIIYDLKEAFNLDEGIWDKNLKDLTIAEIIIGLTILAFFVKYTLD